MSNEEVILETFSSEKVAEEQKVCPDVASHLQNNCPKYVKMDHHEFMDGVNLFCEMSGPKPRPLLPKNGE